MTGSLRPVPSPPAFWPSHRMLWLTALLLIPAAALPAARADGLLWLGAAVGAWALIVTADALFTHHRLNGYSVQAEPQLRAELDKEQLLALDVICRESRPPRALRIALDFPVGLDPIEDDILVAAAPTPFRVQMRFRGRIRGNYVLRCVYLGTTSRLGLWELRRSSPIETRILVQPALGNAVRETVKLLAARKHGGQRLIVRAGRGRDFD